MKAIIIFIVVASIVALHIYREVKWFESLNDEDTMYAMNVMHRNFEESKDRW